MKKHFVIPSAIAALAAVAGNPLVVQAATDVIDNIEVSRGVSIEAVTVSGDYCNGNTFEIYNVSGLTANEGKYDISELTPVKSYTSVEGDEILHIGLETGTYVLKVTPKNSVVLNNYYGLDVNNVNEVIFTVEDTDVFNPVKLGFVNADAAVTDNITLSVRDVMEQSPVSGGVYQVKKIGNDGKEVNLGEYTVEDGLISVSLDTSDPSLISNTYYFYLVSMPEGYFSAEDCFEVFPIEGYNSARHEVQNTEKLGTCTVRIVHEEFSDFMPNTTFVVEDKDGNTYQYTTDETGSVVIKDLPAGDYTAYCHNEEANITGEAVEFSISDNEASLAYVFVKNIEPAGLLVLAKDFYDSADTFVVKVVNADTNEEIGTYDITDGQHVTPLLPVGNYKIEGVTIPAGYEMTPINISITKSEKIYQYVTATEKIKYSTLQLYVYDNSADANAVTDVTVSVYDLDTNDLIAQSVVDENGYVEISNIPYGEHNVVVENIPSKYISIDGKMSKYITFDAETKLDSMVLMIDENPVGECSIEVTIEEKGTHALIANEKVCLIDESGEVISVVTTDEEGMANFTNIPYGTFTFAMEVDSEYYILDTPSVTLSSSQKIAWQTLEVEKITATVNISASCADMSDFNSLQFKLYRDGELHGEYVMENGFIQLENVPVGSYVIELDTPAGYQLTNDYDLTFTVDGNTPVVEKVLMFNQLMGTATATLTTIGTGAPIANMSIYALDKNNEIVSSLVTNPNGQVVFDLPYGTYTIQVDVPNGYLAVADKTVTIEEDNTDVFVDFETKMSLANATITVMDNNGDRVVASIEIVNNKGSVIWSGMTAMSNIIMLTDLPLGTYTINLLDFDNTTYISPGSLDIVLDTEGETVEATYVFEKIQAVTMGDALISVKDEDGNLLDGSENILIGLYDENDNPVVDFAGNPVYSVINQDGTVSFEELELGSYKAKIYYAAEPYLLTEKSTVAFEVTSENPDVETEMTVYKAYGSVLFSIYDAATFEGIYGLNVEIFKDGNSVGVYSSNADGEILVSKLTSGNYTFEVLNMPEAYTGLLDGNFSIDYEYVDEESNVTYVDLELTAKTGQGVLRILDSNNNVLKESIKVVLTDENGNEYPYTVNTNNNGIFNLGWLKIGTYKINVTQGINGYSFVSSEDLVIEYQEDDNTPNTADIVFKKLAGSVSIKVAVQNLEGLGLDGVQVNLYKDNNAYVGTYTTDDQGLINIPEIELGDYKASIVEDSLDDIYSVTTGTSFSIEESAHVDTTISVLRKTGNIQVKVQDENLNAMPNVDVSIYDENGTEYLATKTNQNGNLLIEEVPTGSYTLALTNESLTAKYEIVGGSENLIVENQETANTTITLKRLTGSLKVKCNLPVADILFEVYDGDQFITDGYTDENGEAVFENLETGTYTVRFLSVPSGYRDLEDKNVEILAKVENVLAFDLEEKKSVLNLSYVNKMTGLGVENVTVEIQTLGGQIVKTATTDATGSLSIELPEGSYLINTVAPNGYKVATSDMNKYVEMVDGITSDITIELTEVSVGAVDLTFVDSETKEVLSGVKVSVYNSLGGLYKTYTSDDAGRILDDNVESGNYSIVATLDGYEEVTLNNVSVSESADYVNTVELVKKVNTCTLTVNVTDANGNALSNATVYLRNADGSILTHSVTNELGVAEFANIAYGNYKLSAECNGYHASARIDTMIDEPNEVASISLDEITMGSVLVSVSNEFSTKLANVPVLIEKLDGTYRETVFTNSVGMVNVSNLEAGNYKFYVNVDGYKEYTKTVSVEAKIENVVNIVLEAEAVIGNMDVTVVDTDNNPVANAKVTVEGAESSVTGYTNENGVAIFTELPVGDYVVEVSKDGYVEASQTATVAKDEVAHVSVTLEAIILEGSADITVLNADGSAAGNIKVTIYSNTTVFGTYYTDADGKIAIENMPVGNYTASIENDTIRADFEIKDDENTDVTLTLPAVETKGNALISVKNKDNEMLADAIVTIKNGDEIVLIQTTNPEGVLSVTGLEAGEYTIAVVKDGYKDSSKTIEIIAGDTIEEEFVLYAVATGAMDLTFLDRDTNELLDNVTVKISRDDFEKTVVTDDTGKVVEELIPDVYTLTFSKDGYIAGTQPMEITAGGTSYNHIYMDKDNRGSIDVKVVTQSGQALSNVKVEMKDSNGIPYNGYTDEDGSILFENLEPETYTITCTLDGYITWTDEIDLEANQDQNVVVAMMPIAMRGIAEFTVVDTDDNGIDGAKILLRKENDSSEEYVPLTTDETGFVRVGNLDAGKYNYVVSKDGYIGKVGEFEIVDKLINPVRVVLEKPEIKTYELEVFVVDGYGELMPNATITISSEDYEDTFTTNSEGKVVITRLPVADYKITASMDGYASDSCEITLNKDDEVTLTLMKNPELVEKGDLNIKVQDTDGNALANTDVLIESRENEYSELFTTDENGLIDIELPVGEYVLTSRKDGYLADVKTVEVKESEEASAVLTLEKVTEDMMASAEIIIVNQDNDPVLNANVTICNELGTEIYKGVLDGKNKLYLPDLAPGKYTVMVTKENYAEAGAFFNLEAQENEIVKIVMKENIEDVKAGAFEIMVKDATGKELGNVYITILNEDGSIFGTYTTDGHGLLYLTAVPTGNYSVYASYKDKKSQTVKAEIVENQITTINIVISDVATPEEGGEGENIQTGDSTITKFGLLALLSAVGAFLTRKKNKKK